MRDCSTLTIVWTCQCRDVYFPGSVWGSSNWEGGAGRSSEVQRVYDASPKVDFSNIKLLWQASSPES